MHDMKLLPAVPVIPGVSACGGGASGKKAGDANAAQRLAGKQRRLRWGAL